MAQLAHLQTGHKGTSLRAAVGSVREPQGTGTPSLSEPHCFANHCVVGRGGLVLVLGRDGVQSSWLNQQGPSRNQKHCLPAGSLRPPLPPHPPEACAPHAPPAAFCMVALFCVCVWGGGAGGRGAQYPGDTSQAALKTHWPVMWHRLYFNWQKIDQLLKGFCGGSTFGVVGVGGAGGEAVIKQE